MKSAGGIPCAWAQRPWRSCAVLARTVAQLTAVSHALTRAGVPANVQGRTGARRAFGAAMAEAYACRTPTDLGAWVEAVTADANTDPVRARVAEAADRFLAQRTGLSLRAWVELHSPFDNLEDAQPEKCAQQKRDIDQPTAAWSRRALHHAGVTRSLSVTEVIVTKLFPAGEFWMPVKIP